MSTRYALKFHLFFSYLFKIHRLNIIFLPLSMYFLSFCQVANCQIQKLIKALFCLLPFLLIFIQYIFFDAEIQINFINYIHAVNIAGIK